MMERHGYATDFKITLSRARFKCKNGRMMRTFLSCIQPHPYGAIVSHLLNTENLFLCSSTNYFDNRLLPNDLIIVTKHGDDDEDEHDIKRALERQEDVHINVEIQCNSEFQCLTSSPTRSSRPHQLDIDVQDSYKFSFGRSTYARKEAEINFPMEPVPSPNQIGFGQNCQNNLNIESPTRLGAVHIKTDARVAYDIQLRHS
jgi:hypothetical protein